MGLILVHHDTDSPALYGAVAAAIVATRNCGFMHIAARFDTSRHADAEQHVVATGGLAASGLCWFERLSGKPVSPVASVEAILHAAGLNDIVVPIHSACLADAKVLEELLSGGSARGIQVETITVFDDDGCFRDEATQAILAWRDRFGRIVLKQPDAAKPAQMTIGLVGAESDHRDVYPAVLASLADAADSLPMSIDIRFIDPVLFGQVEDPASLDVYAGILLPGGADMKNVAGQTSVAAFTLDSGLPTVGLCLGMQTMATAVAWRRFGRRNANLAEADPQAGIKTFVAMAGEGDTDGTALPEHRTGDQQTLVAPGTRLASLISREGPTRCNHRFRLNPAILPQLEANGLRVAARGLAGGVVDAVEMTDHPFFMGMQGHPELSSRPGQPHPLLVAFLKAADLRRRTAA
jgi:CTP synthase